GSRVDRETVTKRLRLRLDLGLDRAVALLAVLGQPVENLRDHAPDFLELGDAEAACRTGRRTKANARGDHRLGRVERNTVLVTGDIGASQRLLGDVAGEVLGTKIDKNEVAVGAAGDEREAVLHQNL